MKGTSCSESLNHPALLPYSAMKLWEAANTSDHQHLAEAPLDCATRHSKGSIWSGLPKHGKARDDPGGVGLWQRVWPNARRFVTLSVTGPSLQSDQKSAIRDHICLYPVYLPSLL